MTPANIYMYTHDVPFNGQKLTYGLTGTHTLRAVIQVVLFVWLFYLGNSFAKIKVQ